MSQWTANANEALSLSLVHAQEDRDALSSDIKFKPKFTYPIFGEEEKIYGYKDLQVELRFASGSLCQYLSIKSSSKLASSTADDIEGTLFKFIPPDYLKSKSKFLGRVEEDAKTFKPFGTKIHSYTRSSEPIGNGKAGEDEIEFEVYHATWDTPGFQEYHRRMQLFILLYIEGGSYIQEDEEQWEFTVLYEKRRRADATRTPVYHFVGYSSLYRFYHWPDKLRLRLSQFVILPPYQQQGHGASLYKTIYQFVLSDSNLAELTIEDPSEAFEDLRDKNDLRMLLSHQQFALEAYGESGHTTLVKGKAKLGPPVDKGWAEQWRRDLKLAGRQYQRLIEMLILRALEENDVPANRAFRLQVKERLFRFNYEILAQLEKDERLQKLEETFQSVIEDYQRILALVE